MIYNLRNVEYDLFSGLYVQKIFNSKYVIRKFVKDRKIRMVRSCTRLNKEFLWQFANSHSNGEEVNVLICIPCCSTTDRTTF